MCRDWQKKGIARKRLNETHRRRVDSHKESSTITTVVIVIVVFNMLMYWHYNWSPNCNGVIGSGGDAEDGGLENGGPNRRCEKCKTGKRGNGMRVEFTNG